MPSIIYRLSTVNRIFSSHEPKARVTYCHSALSVVRPSLWHKLLHFGLLLWNRWADFNETWQKARSQRPLPSLCFSGWSEKQDGRPGLWLAETFSTSSLKPLNWIQRNLTGSKISTSSTKFVFFRPIRKTRWLPWPLIGWDIFDFSSETLHGIQRNLTGSKILVSPTKFGFFGSIRKTRWLSLPLIGLSPFHNWRTTTLQHFAIKIF